MLSKAIASPIDTVREFLWRSAPEPPSFDLPTGTADGPAITVYWPRSYAWGPAEKWLIHTHRGLAQLVEVVLTDTEAAWEGGIQTRFRIGNEDLRVVFDYSDYPSQLHEKELANVACYFKFQYRKGGYGDRRVMPGGYPVGSKFTYRYLPGLRRLRKLTPKYDTFARFGLRYSGDLRRQALEALSSQNDFGFHGGTRFVRYCKSLIEASRSRVCIDMPGNGPLCFRLIDYLAMGACVVARRPSAELPAPLVDRKHVIYCKDDLSDLIPLCHELIRDKSLRDSISSNASNYFDTYLHRSQLAQYYLNKVKALRVENSMDPAGSLQDC